MAKPIKTTVVLICLAVLILTGCAAREKKEAYEMGNYYRALEETEQGTMALLEHGSIAEVETIQRFIDFYSIFSAERIRESVRLVYAEDAYFRDGFREVRGRAEIETYFLNTTEAIHECTFDIKDVGYSDGNYYFRWIMKLTLKRDRDHPLEATGMSHVRFDAKGQVVFHQDYWETAALYERLPILGTIIRWVKKRI
ncbi:MAG TPA: nuclear transport factor 2 family protein [Deltaproteobacteria bacterium]|nr:nuclear transport factor 2 family protein [Deltaproteobacteria bacterium]HPJ92841.1 nuclear transport factor 2 family protein [Deltaproteobacteria bacterium]HPR53079.1 nuclear transport factor 2 family protein [Deltaproteobacteria bacterium]